jgi:mono/diheme cytochrome c family protein
MSDRKVNVLVMGVLLIGLIWAYFSARDPAVQTARPVSLLAPEMVPLVTGEEPLAAMFIRAGCPVCHRIPGIPGAEGRVGPPLLLGTLGPQRLQDPAYGGKAKTVHEYVVESVLEPGVFVVPGYPPDTMPNWYGAKLSALALEKIAAYLEQQMTVEDTQKQ